MPNALARSLASVNITASSESAAGASSAPKTPCRARAPSSIASFVRGAAERGGGGEADQADDEGALAAPQVGDTAAEEQQSAEGQGVGRDDPLPVAVGDAQVLLGGGQRDVHDGRVEHDHQLGERDEDERFPAVGVAEPAPFGWRQQPGLFRTWEIRHFGTFVTDGRNRVVKERRTGCGQDPLDGPRVCRSVRSTVGRLEPVD